MEEGCQKCKGVSHTAKIKCEVVQHAEEKGNRKATAIFGGDKSNVQLWRKHKAVISECEASQIKFTVSKEGRFAETDAVFMFFKRDARLE
jgi:hypothetical protein